MYNNVKLIIKNVDGDGICFKRSSEGGTGESRLTVSESMHPGVIG
ncbi:MAG TPA: hypothetical protein VEC37_17830 [Bacillota bacterium]|nr:hypothetical protein [Bacillota bacterium]